MGDVVTLPGKPDMSEYVWVCNCGCTSFELFVDGTARCSHCGAVPADEDGIAHWAVPKAPQPTDDTSAPTTHVTVVNMQQAGGALRHLLNKIDPNTCAMVIVIAEDGRVTTWGNDCTTPEQADWLERRFDDVRMLKVVIPKEDEPELPLVPPETPR